MLTRDIGFALRTLRKNPAFTATAILTIALGIGASTAIFSVVNGVLLRPLPYAQPDRLAIIWNDLRARNVLNFPMASGDLPDIKEQATAFETIAIVNSGRVPVIRPDGKPEQIDGAFVSPNFFTLLGARIAFGRNFTSDDATPPPPQAAPDPNAPPAPPLQRPPLITILSHAYWQTAFGGDSGVIGKTFQIGGGPATIVGVLEPDFKIVMPPVAAVAETPELYGVARVDFSTASRINVQWRVIGRLRPGATLATANAQLAKLALDLQSRFPIKKAAGLAMRAESMQADVVKEVRPGILALMGAVMFVLLIACANVANLLLVRAAARERELAVRSALGGSRNRLVAQMLLESVVLAVLGAALGLLLAKLGIDLLISIAPANLPRVDSVDIDPMVLGFAFLSALVSALVFGVIPAIRASRPNLAQTLRAGGRSPGLNSGKMLRQGVVIAEVALSFVLLVGAGLMLRSFIALSNVDPGYDPKGVLTFTAFNAGARSLADGQAYVSSLENRLKAIPGVSVVTAATPLPLDGTDQNSRWGTLEAKSDASKFQQATLHIVHPGYFDAMRTKLLAGHDFGPAENQQNNTSIIIDNLLAAKAFPGQSPQSIIGKQLFCRINTPEAQFYQVIGVVQHQRHMSLAVDGREAIYTPEMMFGPGAASRWAIRTTGDPSRLIPEVRRAINDVNPLVPVGEIKPMSDYVDRAMAPTRFSLVLIAIFGVVAAALAAIGLYGVLSTTVRQRTSEIGVRMAFGATSESVFRLMLGQGMALSAIGIGVGLAAALALTGLMQKAAMLISIKPTDPLTYAAMAVLFAAIAAVACWVPARRAAGLDPNVALREE
jgi:predicted permease